MTQCDENLSLCKVKMAQYVLQKLKCSMTMDDSGATRHILHTAIEGFKDHINLMMYV